MFLPYLPRINGNYHLHYAIFIPHLSNENFWGVNKPITIHFALENPVPDELYLDFMTRTDTLGKESISN